MERKHLKQLNTCVDYMSNLHFIYIPMNLRLTDHKHRFIAAIKKIFPWSVFNVCVQCVWQWMYHVSSFMTSLTTLTLLLLFNGLIVIHGSSVWLLYIDPLSDCHTWILCLIVIHGSPVWLLYMDPLSDCYTWILCLVVIHGSSVWLLYMDPLSDCYT